MAISPLTRESISAAKDDDELFELLGCELTRTIGPGRGSDIDNFVRLLSSLPVGLRSMAAVYELDVSLALDDVGWHFANWHSRALSEETLAGLQELGAILHAKLFAEAMRVSLKHWTFIGSDVFKQQYAGSELEAELGPVNEGLWDLQGYRSSPGNTILSYWAPYARKFPERVSSL